MKRFLTIFLFFLISSCELIVDVDVPFEGEQLVINSFISPDSLWSATITRNRFILSKDESFKPVTNAIVTVYDESEPVATLHHIGEGKYRSQMEKPVIGKQYTIRAEAQNFPAVDAQSWIPAPATITSVEIENVIRDNKPTQVAVVRFKDDGATKDFYHIRLEVMEDHLDYQTNEIYSMVHVHPDIISDNPALNAQVIPVDAGLLVKDVLFNGKEGEVRLRTDYYNRLPQFSELHFIVRSVSEDYYNYMATKYLQDGASGDPFAQPVNVYNNVSNGFGIFAGLSSSMYVHHNPEPVILEISPSSGKAGDILTITGKNFGDYMNMYFRGAQGYSAWSAVIDPTETQFKVVVPEDAVTGKIAIFKDAMATESDFEFEVIE